MFMSLGPLIYVYAERKISAFMQDRIGPNRVGPIGLLQTLADTIKLLFKEAIFPKRVDKKLFVIAPILVNVGAFMPFLVIPWGGRLQPADLNVGVFYVVAIASLSTVGLIMAGWASNNKYSLFGAMRSAAQIVSYEIPAMMILLVPVMIVGSLSLQDITMAQYGGLPNWFLFRYFPLMPIAFLVFFTAGLAETNRAPFDIPEAESELVGGFHTEYSGFFFAMFFMAEYTEMFVFSAMATVLFLGGYLAPHPALQQIGSGPARLVLDVVQGLVAGLRDDVAALDAAPLARRPAHAHRLEGAAADRPRAGGRGGRARPVAADRGRLPLGPLGGLAADPGALRLPLLRDGPRGAVEPPPHAGAAGGVAMKRWLEDVWDGFFTVLVGMRITWRHLFTQPVTLQYPTEKWPLPPKSRMRLFMKYEDCIGCGQCVRACPVNCISIKAEKRPPTRRRSGPPTGSPSSST